MGRLSDGDIKVALTFLRGVYSSLDSDEFASHATRNLRLVVPADRASYNKLYDKPGKFRIFIEPQGAELGGPLREAMSRLGDENPHLVYYRRTGRADVCTFSDLVSRAQLHRLALFNEYYRRIEVEHQVVVPLSLGSPGTREVGFALSRRRTDFSSRDRSLLELLQPHLVQAYANSRALTRIRAGHACLESLAESNGQGAVLLSRAGGIRFATQRSRELLRAYFGEGRVDRDRLPDDLAGWLRHETKPLDEEAAIATPRQPLVVVRDERRLTVRLLEEAGTRVLVLEETADRIDVRALEARGLTRREGEVLAWVARGKTNAEVASILGTRPATVAKHLERIYPKLGVETRTAAAIQALSTRNRSSVASSAGHQRPRAGK